MLALTLAAPALAQTGSRPSLSPPASVRVVECVPGDGAEDGLAVFRGAMRKVPGTHRMWMRFGLQERSGGGAWRSLDAPGLGVWRKSRPGVRKFAHRQRVVALPAGSAYRVLVRYRWYSATGERLQRAARRSAGCRQPGSLPDLRVARISAKPLEGTPGAVRYLVHVRNEGGAEASQFKVRLAVDGDVLDTRTVEGLAPGAVARVAFAGPSCVSAVEARVDPADVVREGDELDNGLSSPCPPQG